MDMSIRVQKIRKLFSIIVSSLSIFFLYIQCPSYSRSRSKSSKFLNTYSVMIQLLLSILKPTAEIHLLRISGKPHDPKAADEKDR